jgi:cytochrome d ubiquinol oxidase subunit I
MFLSALVDWSRAQFALTAIFHWTFVPLTLGLGIMLAIMETMYVRTGNEFWKRTVKFWMKLFGINFAMGVATGLILEFQFGTNWSNYSWFVGDIFGAPLAIEGIVAFFLEATFMAVMFFGWNRVSKRFHLTSTWLTAIGANLSALWILVANAWMQYPTGVAFNPDTARNEMVNFWDVLFSPVAMNKFFHTVTSGFMLSAAFVIGVSCWFLLRKRETQMAMKSIKLASVFGLAGICIVLWTGDGSAQQVAKTQPMKLAAMEGLYEGQTNAPLVLFGVLNNDKKHDDNQDPYLFKISMPGMLSWLSFGDTDAYVPGIKNIIDGYESPYSSPVHAVPFADKVQYGKIAVEALQGYQQAKADKNTELMESYKTTIDEYFPYFGYGYLDKPEELIPNLPLVFYSFHIMVILGGYFLIFFALAWWWQHKKKIENQRWFLLLAMWSIFLAYIATYAGWIVAEVGRQPWTIQDLLPVSAAISGVKTGAVQTTFFMFAVLFGIMLIAEIKIMLAQIKKGPSNS